MVTFARGKFLAGFLFLLTSRKEITFFLVHTHTGLFFLEALLRRHDSLASRAFYFPRMLKRLTTSHTYTEREQAENSGEKIKKHVLCVVSQIAAFLDP